MTKLNNKGFFLAETIVITGIVAAFLAIFYFQISTLYRNYERNARYNTVDAVHAAHTIDEYLNQVGITDLMDALNASGQPLYDFTNFAFDSTDYFKTLVASLNIDKVYFSQYNINNVIANYATYDINAEFLDFLKTQKVSDVRDDTYRIIVILKTGIYSSILVQY